MSEYYFGLAEIEDMFEILEFYNDLVDTPGCAWTLEYPNSEIIETDILAKSLFVLKENTTIISVAFAGREEELERFTWQSKKPCDMARIGVIRSKQSQGIGTIMLNKVIREVHEYGFDGIRILVSKTNPSALALYDKNGFIRLDEVNMHSIDFYRYERLL